MIKEAIVKIVNKEDLSYTEAYTVMNEIMNGETSPAQNAAFLAALSTKSARAETTEEIAGCAAAMRAHAIQVDTGMDVFEIVGTGGDHAHSFNISTTSALVAAAGGMKVAKHGNQAASSQCGTADCLEALQGGTPLENARITLSLLQGSKGPKRNAVLMNAGAALYIGGKANSLQEGIQLAGELIDSGKALKTLQQFIQISNREVSV